jgi:pilus assembly protein CpaD
MSKAYDSRPRVASGLTIVIGVAFALTGCSSLSSIPGLYDDNPNPSYVRQYDPAVNQGDMTLNLPLSSRSRQFSDNQVAEIEAFVEEYKRSGQGPLTILRPTGSANELVAASGAAHITRMLPRSGLTGNRVIARTYYAGRANPSAPIRLTYKRYFANAKPCGDWSRNLAVTYSNKVPPNFGCAHYHNLAAMVANPRDLQSPRATTPPDAARRDEVMGKYRKGTPTATQRSSKDSGNVSNVK